MDQVWCWKANWTISPTCCTPTVQLTSHAVHCPLLFIQLKDGSGIGKNPLISRLLKGVFQSRAPQKPKYTEDWDVQIVLSCLKTLHEVELLSLKVLLLNSLCYCCWSHASGVRLSTCWISMIWLFQIMALLLLLLIIWSKVDLVTTTHSLRGEKLNY